MLTALLGQAGAPLRILCLGAHCDDIEIGCGGAVLRLLEERPGSTVRWVALSSNPEREREARASATGFLAGAGQSEIVIKEFRDGYLPFHGVEVKDFFESIKKDARPDLILTHHRHDRHQDHRMIAELTWNTWRNHLIAEYEIPKYEGDLGQPNVFVALAPDVAARKVELIMKHFGTQHDKYWFRPETFAGLMAVRGVEAGAAAAEAFHVRKLVL